MAKLKIDIKPSIQRLDLVFKGLVNTGSMGNYASAFKGKGLEFANYRNYTQNDDASLIDWKASHRAGKTLVKEFVEERNLNVFFLLDSSSRMLLGSADKLKVEYAAELIASLSHVILKAGDSVGLTMFSDKIIRDIHVDNGLTHFQIISNSLSDVSLYGGGSNMKKALNHALRNFEDHSLLFLISDFIGYEAFAKELKFAAMKFDLIGVMIRDPVDIELPSGYGQVQVEDPVTGERMLISPNKLKKMYDWEVKKEIVALKKLFRNSGADFLPLYADQSFVKELMMFFEKRVMEWR